MGTLVPPIETNLTSDSEVEPEGEVSVSEPDIHAARLARIKTSIFKRFSPNTTNLHLLEKAWKDSEFHHRTQVRKSGEPYFLHPARVAQMTAESGLDVETVIIALLHDVIEDTEVTKEEMRREYGDWLAEVVDGLTKVVSNRQKQIKRPIAVETYRKLISSTIKDLRTLQVKIFDRLDNMRDLGYLSRLRQRAISQETMNVYMPMAQRLGMQDISNELTALSFRYLYPKRFNKGLARLKECIQAEQFRAKSLQTHLEKNLKDIKRIKMEVRPRYHQISDFIYDETGVKQALMGFKVVVPTMQDCYRALGNLHMYNRVVPNSIKDFISNPKPNRYQALRSQIFIAGEPISIQIVSLDMERVNANGILAGWEGSLEDLSKYYQSYLDLLDHYSGNDDLRMEDVLRHAQMDTLQIFTPKGELLSFSQGATVLDFAFAIHTDLGLRCDGGWMAGRRVSRFEELRDGEVVEVISNSAISPNWDWLDKVTTTRAKLGIRRFLNAQVNTRAQEVGKRLFEAETHRLGEDPESMLKRKAFQAALKKKKLSQSQFFQHVGADKLPLRQFFMDHNLVGKKALKKVESQEQSILGKWVKPILRQPAPVITIHDLEDGFIKMAGCCSPLLGDSVMGVQEGAGIMVHRSNCPVMLQDVKGALIHVGWDVPAQPQGYALRIHLSEDRPGLLYKVSKVMRDLKVNILDINLERDNRSNAAVIQVRLEPVTHKVFRGLISKLRDVREVKKIKANPLTPANQLS